MLQVGLNLKTLTLCLINGVRYHRVDSVWCWSSWAAGIKSCSTATTTIPSTSGPCCVERGRGSGTSTPPPPPPLGADLVARSLPGNAVLLDGHLLPSHRQLLKEKININKLSRLLRLMPYIASLSLPMQQKLTYHNIYNPYGSSSLCGSNGLWSKYICSLSAEQTTLGWCSTKCHNKRERERERERVLPSMIEKQWTSYTHHSLLTTHLTFKPKH